MKSSHSVLYKQPLMCLNHRTYVDFVFLINCLDADEITSWNADPFDLASQWNYSHCSHVVITCFKKYKRGRDFKQNSFNQKIFLDHTFNARRLYQFKVITTAVWYYGNRDPSLPLVFLLQGYWSKKQLSSRTYCQGKDNG